MAIAVDMPRIFTNPETVVALAYKAAKTTGRIMVSSRYSKRRHLKLHVNGPHDVWVRTGKRGQHKERLLSAKIISDNPFVAEFTSGWRDSTDGPVGGKPNDD
jgi:hypothetical protein